jgi:hypothetical protein
MERDHTRVVGIAVFAATMLLATQGFCDTETEINEVTNKVSHLLFSPTIRKVVLTIGAGAGLFQAFLSGSIRPLLVWGGLGLAVCYLPTLVNWIGGL